MDAAFEGVGLEAPGYEKTRRIIGLSLQTGLQVLAPNANEATLEAVLTSYRDVFMARRSDPAFASPLYEGVPELLKQLRETGWRLGIATGKSRRGLDAMIEQFGWSDVFETHWCADDGPGKPHPHMVLENIRTQGADPARTVVIGDSEHDMAMAIAAGTYALGVTWGFGTRAEMYDAGAHEVLETMENLASALNLFQRKAALTHSPKKPLDRLDQTDVAPDVQLGRVGL